VAAESVFGFQPSLRDGAFLRADPGVETPGYSQMPLRDRMQAPQVCKGWLAPQPNRFMSTTLDLNPPILEAIKPECTAKLLGLGRGQIKVPDFDPDHLLFHVIVAPDGTRQFKAITPQEAGGRIPGNPYDLLARVRRQCPGFPLSFPRQHTDAQGHAWDLVCAGTLTAADARRFAERGLGLASVGAPLRRDRLAAWLAQDLGMAVQDCLRAELNRRSFEDLREKNVLPAEWWSRQFAPGLERFGLQLTDLEVRWKSADSSRAEQAERDRQAQAKVRKQVEDENHQRLEQARREEELARSRAEIDTEEIDRRRDLKMKGMASQEQLDRLEEEFKQRRLQAEQKHREAQLAGEMRLQDLQRGMEKRALEHEQEMIGLRGKAEQQRRQQAEAQQRLEQEAGRKADVEVKKLAAELAQAEEGAKQAAPATAEQRGLAELRIERLRLKKDQAEHEVKAASERAKIAELERQKAELAVRQAQEDLQHVQEQRRQAERMHEAQAQGLADVKEELKKLFSGFTSEVLTGLFQKNQTTAYNAASSITAHGLSAQQLQAMGIDTQLSFIERLQDSTVQVRKNNLKRKRYSTRDIVIGPAKEVEFDTLFVHEKVDFDLTSPRSGYVTIINLGTSGKFWLHVPNAYRPLPRIEGRRAYQVPGPELLPEDKLEAAGLAFYESGPAGWEYIVVIVSDEPLMDTAVLGRFRDQAPVIELSSAELQGALDRLERMGRDHWAAGVAKFRVEPAA